MRFATEREKMKKIIAGFVLAAVAAACFAEENGERYARVGAGFSLPGDASVTVLGGSDAKASFDPGPALRFAVGETWERFPFVRTEIEANWMQNDVKSIESSWSTTDGEKALLILAGMLNGYVDWDNESLVTPYMMGGIGIAYVDVKLNGYHENDIVPVAQLGFGAGIEITERISVDLAYRYFRGSNPSFDEQVRMELSSHMVQAGLRIVY